MGIRVSCLNFDPTVRKIYTDKEQPAAKVTLGNGSYLVEGYLDFYGPQCHVLIGNYSSIAHGIKFIVAANHDSSTISTYPFQEVYEGIYGNNPSLHPECNHCQIIIGNDVWIGAYATIMGGVRIGNGAVIGAGAVVAKDVPPYAVVVGNPAKIIRYRFNAATIAWLQNLRWWNWSPEKVKSCWQEMKNMEAFQAKYPQPSPVPISSECQKMRNIICQFKAYGAKLYYFVPDLLSKEKIWQNVLQKFVGVGREKILFMDMSDEYPDDVKTKFAKLIESCQHDNLILNQHGKNVAAEHIIPLMDYVITTKEAESSYIADIASQKGRHILYGMDFFSV